MITRLESESLFKRCDPGEFRFNTTDDLDEFTDIIGQERALKALDFGLGMNSMGFNIFALGESGTGKVSTIMSLLKNKASVERIPPDWCYVNNFKDPDNPIAIYTEPGKGVAFQKDMEELVRFLRIEIPKAFESKEYDTQRNKIIDEFQQKQNEYLARLDEEVKKESFAVRKGPAGIFIIPVKETGEPLTKEEFDALDEKTKMRMEETGRRFQERLNDIVRLLKDSERLVRDMLARLERMIALEIIEPAIESIKGKYKENEKITTYLNEVKNEILTHLDEFKTIEEPPSPFPFLKLPKQEPLFSKYAVNVIVNNEDSKGAPVVFETNPTYPNLFGRVEYKVTYGIATTDFTMIKAGSLHKANGGYLVVEALDLFKNPFSYDAVKRALKNKEIKIEDILEQYRLFSTSILKPEAIPLNIKVIIVGSPYIYYILRAFDEESRELFKVKADFDNRMDRTKENVEKYAGFVSICQRNEGLLPFDRAAVAKIVEYGSRLAEHQEKLSMKFSEIADLIRESHYWADRDRQTLVMAGHVEKAIKERIYRVNMIETHIREMMLEDTLIVNTEGVRIGQVNGLAVLDMGDHSFGKPSRITAKTYTGKAGIVNIERETKMSGKIHEKAIMIISSYLGSRYAVKKPISLSASITFEQLYEMIEGDSATIAELYALLSSISGVPLKQGIAVTGSMDQNGEVQPIGGVNEKIEGFFDLCNSRGLNGEHGVIIPRRNIKNLNLKWEVVEAVRDGRFNIYAIDRMEEGLEILTDLKAGELDEQGLYPEGTINYLVTKRLTEITESMEKKKDKESDNEDRENNEQKCKKEGCSE